MSISTYQANSWSLKLYFVILTTLCLKFIRINFYWGRYLGRYMTEPPVMYLLTSPSGGYMTEHTNIPLEPWNSYHFSSINQQQIDRNNITKFLCPKLSNVQLLGNFFSIYMNYIIWKCTPINPCKGLCQEILP